MDRMEYEWLVKNVQRRYVELRLTFKQAEHIFNYEAVVSEPSSADCLTRWEELDFELATMRSILSPAQLAIYQVRHAEEREFYETQLQGMNTAQEQQLAYYRAVLQDYQNTLLPLLHRQLPLKMIQQQGSAHHLSFLWAEYAQQLRQQWQETVAHHYRQYRSFGPQALEAQQLQQELLQLWPEYRWFRRRLSKPVRQLVGAMLESNYVWYKIHEKQVQQVAQEQMNTQQLLYDQHFGLQQGFVHTADTSRKDIREAWLFRLLMLSQHAPGPGVDQQVEQQAP